MELHHQPPTAPNFLAAPPARHQVDAALRRRRHQGAVSASADPQRAAPGRGNAVLRAVGGCGRATVLGVVGQGEVVCEGYGGVGCGEGVEGA